MYLGQQGPWLRIRCSVWQCDRLTAISSMSEGDETAKLWKVNRTIHELVKDRVGLLFFFQSDIAEHFAQGFAVADDEIQMDLAAFRQHYANNTGGVE